MIRFFKHITIIFIITLLCSFVIDKGIFEFFYQYHKRAKLDVQGLNKDVVFFGSSRCIHHVNPRIIDSICHVSSYNMGWAAANPREIYAAIKIYLTKNRKPKLICIQLDLEHDDTTEDCLARQSLLKFYGKGILDDYYSEQLNNELKIPLYASIKYRDFGWREMLKTIFNNSNVSQNNLGYIPMLTNKFHGDMKVFNIHLLFDKKNSWIAKSIEICLKNNIRVFLFTSPICSKKMVAKFDNLGKMYNVDYYNWSNYFRDNISYFSDKTHLNSNGADNFTKELGLFLRNSDKTNSY